MQAKSSVLFICLFKLFVWVDLLLKGTVNPTFR